MNKNLLIGLLVVAALAAGGFLLVNRPVERVVERVIERQLGASLDEYSPKFFHDSVVLGGDVLTISTTSAAYTLTATQVCDNSEIQISGGDTPSLTFPTVANLISAGANGCLQTNGQYHDLIITNANANAASTYTVTAGTSMTLLAPESTGADVVINGGNKASVRLLRKSATEILGLVEEWIDAD